VGPGSFGRDDPGDFEKTGAGVAQDNVVIVGDRCRDELAILPDPEGGILGPQLSPDIVIVPTPFGR